MRQIAIKCIRSSDQKPYLHNERKGGKIAFNPLVSRKRLDRASIVQNMKPKNFGGGHLTRTQNAAGPSEESMRNNPVWIVKCKFRDFRATWRYIFSIL